MAGTVRTGKPGRSPRLNLNSDGQSHPLLNVGELLHPHCRPGVVRARPVPADRSERPARLGGRGGGHGPRGPAGRPVHPDVSATREERIIIVTGIIAGFVGLALGLANGGLASAPAAHRSRSPDARVRPAIRSRHRAAHAG